MADRIAATRPAAIPEDPAGGGVPIVGILLAIVDFPLLAAGYRVVIEAAPDLRVAGVAERGDRVPEQVARLSADLVIIGWPPSTSADCASAGTIEEIRAARPDTRILAIESRCGRQPTSPATGAHGFLARDARPADVLTALRCLGRGEAWVSPSVSSRVLAADARPSAPAAGDDAFDTLSERAREVFRLAAVGQSTREIARQLQVSEQTVHNHRALIMEKLGLHRRVELLRYALRRGIIRATEL